MTGRLEIPESETELRVFHNRLRILISIDMHELVEGGVIGVEEKNKWANFRSNPYRFFIRCDDDTANKLWGIIQEREA